MSSSMIFNTPSFRTLTLLCLGSYAAQGVAADWLMMQGTEGKNAPEYRVQAHLQPQYTYHDVPELTDLTGGLARFNGNVLALNLVAPQLDTQKQFNVRRAGLGVRGKIDDQINYHILLQGGENTQTYNPFNDRSRMIALSDLSATFNHIPWARVRVGLFKNPGSEEVLQGLINQNYTELTDFQARVNLERFSSGGVKLGGSPEQNAMGTPIEQTYGSSAFRDWGVQVFNTVQGELWDLSYAVKLGRGEAIYKSGKGFSNPELYLYGAAEYRLPGGKNAFRHGIKTYAWYQDGSRRFSSDESDTSYDRTRYGIGVRALGQFFDLGVKQRIQMEWMQADGMIYKSPAAGIVGNPLQYAAAKGNKAKGGYLDFGLYVTDKLEFGVRYDRNELLYTTAGGVNPGNFRLFQTMTYAVNYHFEPKLRVSFNYLKRDSDNPNDYTVQEGFSEAQATALTGNVSKLVDNLGDRYTLQLTWIY